jgi:hypothetical protein
MLQQYYTCRTSLCEGPEAFDPGSVQGYRSTNLSHWGSIESKIRDNFGDDDRVSLASSVARTAPDEFSQCSGSTAGAEHRSVVTLKHLVQARYKGITAPISVTGVY